VGSRMHTGTEQAERSEATEAPPPPNMPVSDHEHDQADELHNAAPVCTDTITTISTNMGPPVHRNDVRYQIDAWNSQPPIVRILCRDDVRWLAGLPPLFGSLDSVVKTSGSLTLPLSALPSLLSLGVIIREAPRTFEVANDPGWIDAALPDSPVPSL